MALENCGKTVTRVNEIPYGSLFFISKNLYKPASIWLIRRHEKRIQKLIKECGITEIMIIRGAFLPESLFTFIRQSLPDIKIWHYQWDSIRNNPNARMIASYADRNFSFDRKDCVEDNRFTYLPLFYSAREASYVRNKPVKPAYDLIFIGSFHLFRFSQLAALKNYLKGQGVEFYFRIYIPPFVFVKYLLRGKIRGNFDCLRFRKFDKSELIDATALARCVLDLPSPTQSGCTMRLIESLAYNKAILTTNRNITGEVFYRPESIKVVDFESAAFDQFRQLPDPPGDILNTIVEINNWVRTIAGDNNSKR
jgi:hypothetical protein